MRTASDLINESIAIIEAEQQMIIERARNAPDTIKAVYLSQSTYCEGQIAGLRMALDAIRIAR